MFLLVHQSGCIFAIFRTDVAVVISFFGQDLSE